MIDNRPLPQSMQLCHTYCITNADTCTETKVLQFHIAYEKDDTVAMCIIRQGVTQPYITSISDTALYSTHHSV